MSLQRQHFLLSYSNSDSNSRPPARQTGALPTEPIQEAIDDLLLPTLFGQTEPLPSDLRQLATLTLAQVGLDVPDLRFEAPQLFAASTFITLPHVASITAQSMFTVADITNDSTNCL